MNGWRGAAVNAIGQSKRGGGDRSSRPAQLEARENEQKALSLWIKGATFQQIAAAGFGIATARGAWHAVHRALARIPKQEADQAREAQLARLQAVRMLGRTRVGSLRFMKVYRVFPARPRVPRPAQLQARESEQKIHL